MSVIFESTIKCNDMGLSYIELKDTVDGRVVNCSDIEEYSKKIEELGSDYGGRIDEVKWTVDKNVPQTEVDKIRLAMDKFKENMDKK